MKTITCKLPERLDAELEALARQEGLSKSELVRQAIETRVKKGRSTRSPRAIDLIRDLVGSVEGPGDLASNPKHMDGFGA